MPAVQSIDCTQGLKLAVAGKLLASFAASDMTPAFKTTQDLESYLNGAWKQTNINGDFQIRAHVFSLSPLSLTVLTANAGEKIPPNWWLDFDVPVSKIDAPL